MIDSDFDGLVTNSASSRPLVTLYLLSYNRAAFLREALESAFAQTYSPLEIVISDNYSTDNSFQIIKEAVASYKGPHRIIVNRNDANLGLIGNVNKAASLSHGELLVYACDDDVSCNQRVQVIVDAWNKVGRTAKAIASSYALIDISGRKIGEHHLKTTGIVEQTAYDFVRMENPVAAFCGCGAVMAYHRDVFAVFGPIGHTNVVDDQVLVRRARILGDVLAVDDILVKYRIGAGITTDHQAGVHCGLLRWLTWTCSVLRQIRDDLVTIRPKLGDNQFTALAKGVAVRLAHAEAEENLYSSCKWTTRAIAFLTLCRQPKPTARLLGGIVCLCFPRSWFPAIFQVLYNCRTRMRL